MLKSFELTPQPNPGVQSGVRFWDQLFPQLQFRARFSEPFNAKTQRRKGARQSTLRLCVFALNGGKRRGGHRKETNYLSFS